MPIGKNAIKRVSSSTSAQSNTPVAEPKAKEEKVEAAPAQAPAKKPATKKPAAPKTQAKTAPKAQAKPAPQKSMEKEPDLSPVSTAKKVTKKPQKANEAEFSHICIGQELPIYLL